MAASVHCTCVTSLPSTSRSWSPCDGRLRPLIVLSCSARALPAECPGDQGGGVTVVYMTMVRKQKEAAADYRGRERRL